MTAAECNRAAAQSRAEALKSILLEIGTFQSLRHVAEQLNAREVPTERDGKWHPATVARVLRRLGIVPGVELQIGSIGRLPPNSVSAVVTSPPYANQRKRQYGGVSPADYPAWTVAWMEKIRPALVEKGNVAIVICPHSDEGQISDYVLRTRLAVREAGWIEPGDLYWIKRDAAPMGNINRPRRAVETILWFSTSRRPYCDPKANGTPSANLAVRGKKGEGVTFRGNRKPYSGVARCLDFTEVAVASNDRSSYNHHPAPYPTKLAEWIIQLLSPPEGVVFDPFMGSGSTAIAARNVRRRFIGCDIREDYVAIARQRLSKQSPATA